MQWDYYRKFLIKLCFFSKSLFTGWQRKTRWRSNYTYTEIWVCTHEHQKSKIYTCIPKFEYLHRTTEIQIFMQIYRNLSILHTSTDIGVFIQVYWNSNIYTKIVVYIQKLSHLNHIPSVFRKILLTTSKSWYFYQDHSIVLQPTPPFWSMTPFPPDQKWHYSMQNWILHST